MGFYSGLDNVGSDTVPNNVLKWNSGSLGFDLVNICEQDRYKAISYPSCVTGVWMV